MIYNITFELYCHEASVFSRNERTEKFKVSVIRCDILVKSN